MRIMLVLAMAACGSGGGEKRALPEPAAPAAEPVRVELAWLLSAAPTEVKEVECQLVLRVIRPGGDQNGEIHEVGVWWRAQQAAIELVDAKLASGPVLFQTKAE